MAAAESDTMTNYMVADPKRMRVFQTGATRDLDETKVDYEGHISPLVTKRYGQYMHEHRKQADGAMRASDNWQLGIDKTAYLKSLVRHMEDVKLIWDGYVDEATEPDMEKALCAVIFNAQGLMFEILKEKRTPRLLVPEPVEAPQ